MRLSICGAKLLSSDNAILKQDRLFKNKIIAVVKQTKQGVGV